MQEESVQEEGEGRRKERKALVVARLYETGLTAENKRSACIREHSSELSGSHPVWQSNCEHGVQVHNESKN